MQSYDYSHRSGIRPISWDEFGLLARQLAEKLAGFQPTCVVGIARAGLFPATEVACALRLDLFPVRLTRRERDQVVRKTPAWIIPVPEQVAGQVVVVVDEMADTGETLRLAAEEILSKGAARVVAASLVRHSWASPQPEACALVTDELVIFPWDAQVLVNGTWQIHPELMNAMKILRDE